MPAIQTAPSSCVDNEEVLATLTVVNCDSFDYMRTMPDQGVATVVTSPPYNLGKSYSCHNDNMPEAQYLHGRMTWRRRSPAYSCQMAPVPECRV
jgi:hypothetical protein